jgi:hypothetical protein
MVICRVFGFVISEGVFQLGQTKPIRCPLLWGEDPIASGGFAVR